MTYLDCEAEEEDPIPSISRQPTPLGEHPPVSSSLDTEAMTPSATAATTNVKISSPRSKKRAAEDDLHGSEDIKRGGRRGRVTRSQAGVNKVRKV